MDATCRHCGRTTGELRALDIPSGAVLCEDCFNKFVWKCTQCDRSIAYPEIEGGQIPGITPLQQEAWCHECCDELIGSCDVCGAEELVEDLTATDEGLQCERCKGGHGPTEQDDPPPLTKDNWIENATEAVGALPEDLRSSVGHALQGKTELLPARSR